MDVIEAIRRSMHCPLTESYSAGEMACQRRAGARQEKDSIDDPTKPPELRPEAQTQYAKYYGKR